MMDCYNSITETNQISNPKITKMVLNFLCVTFRHHFEEIMLIIICTLLLNNKEILLKRYFFFIATLLVKLKKFSGMTAERLTARGVAALAHSVLDGEYSPVLGGGVCTLCPGSAYPQSRLDLGQDFRQHQ